MGSTELNMEECASRISAGLEKLQYLVGSINQKFEKSTSAMTGPEKEAFIYERDNIRIHLDIADDYIHELVCIVDELLAGVQHEWAESYKNPGKGGVKNEWLQYSEKELS